jgi:hypothetical protein
VPRGNLRDQPAPNCGHEESRETKVRLDRIDPGQRAGRSTPEGQGAKPQAPRRSNRNRHKILGKYLPSLMSMPSFRSELRGQTTGISPRGVGKWVEDIMRVEKEECQIPAKPAFEFDHNTKLLEECGWDLGEAIRRQKGSTADHGSDFRPLNHLRRVVVVVTGHMGYWRMLNPGYRSPAEAPSPVDTRP